MNKVIIWGHKLHTHTHSYIHNSYFNAFKKMGFETFWFDNNDDVSNFNFDSCIFLTEGQVDQRIPLNNTSFYILHHCNRDKYINSGCKIINLCNYLNDCKLNLSPNYDTEGVEKISYYSYYDKLNSALYQPWGTELFPDEIGNNIINIDESKQNVNYIGSIWSENQNYIQPFANSCFNNGKKFQNFRSLSDEDSRKLVVDSYISPDIRGQHHINVGYIPCRIFKNISYGCIPATNSEFVRDFLGDNTLPYSSDTYNLFDVNKEFLHQNNINDIGKSLMNEIKENHTFITRIKTLLMFL
jgi:hypothetical protein